MIFAKKYFIPALVLLALLVAITWWWRSTGARGELGAILVSTTISETGGQALRLVERLKNIKIDTAFFNDQQFLDLESAPKTDITGIPKGRSNPFRK